MSNQMFVVSGVCSYLDLQVAKALIKLGHRARGTVHYRGTEMKVRKAPECKH